MASEKLLQLRHYAIHLREVAAAEERRGTERSKLPSWKDTKRLLLTWADDLDQEANETERTNKPTGI